MTTPDSTTPMKRCKKCGVEFPSTTEYFYKHETGRDGLRNSCKSCHYRSRRERALAYAKEYSQRPEVIVRRNEWLRERMKDPIVHQKKIECDRRYHASPEAKAKRKPTDPDKRRKYRMNPEIRAKEREYAKEYNQRPEVIEHRRQQQRKRWHARKETEEDKALRRFNQLRRRSAGGKFTPADIEAIRKAQGNRCYICHKKLGKKYHIDHFIPIAKGGTSDPGNLRLACPWCNQSKGAKHPHDIGILL